jgi:hypothetical protein|tara:strand:+ start:254 stop:895 length:642 start_codon:yes stop_codon:yes gene_type:complete
MSKTNDLEKIISRTSFENIRSNNIVKSLTPEVEASGMNWFSIIKYGLIILILAMLGFNLFTYLGMFTDATASVVAPLTKIFGKSSGDILKQTAVVSGEGSKGLIDVVSGSIVGGVDVLQQNVTDNNVRSRITRNKLDDNSNSDETYYRHTNNFIPVADDAGSTTQTSQSKSGFCYIGEDRGFRSCIEVNENDSCLSGEIFPSRAICVNPNLRE